MIAWQPPTRFPFRPAPRLQLNHAQLVGPQTLSLIRGLIIDSLCPDLANKSLWRLLTPPNPLSPISLSPTSLTLSFTAHSPSFPCPGVQWQRFQACFSLELTVWATPDSFFFYSPWRMKNNLAAKARQAARGCPCPTRLRIHSIWARKEWIKINDGQIFIASL